MHMATQDPQRTETELATAITTAPAVGYTLPTHQFKIPGLVPPILSGAFLWACYFPLAWGPLAWVALAPLLGLVRSQMKPRNIYFCAWLGGFTFFLPILHWMTYGDQGMEKAWVMLAIYCALYFPAAVWLTRLLERRTKLPLVVTFPAAWVGLEFARSYLLSGFAWYYLGHSQHAILPLIQVADLAGVYAVSFLVAAVNAWAFDLLYQFEGLRRLFQLREPPGTRTARIIEGREFFGEIFRRRLFLEALAVALFVAAAVVYGHVRIGQERFLPGPRIALLQGNIDQVMRNRSHAADGPQDIVKTIIDHYGTLCTNAVLQTPKPDLLIWPESSFPAPWYEASLDVSPSKISPKNRKQEIDMRKALHDWTTGYGAAMLFGINSRVIDKDGRENKHNSAVLINAHGSQTGRYDKIHRVPFGEFVPFRDSLPFMDAFAAFQYDYSIRAGETMTRLPLKEYHFGVLICYEDTDPFLARQYVRDHDDGGPVDFFVNISNDGWFDGSAEHEEHLAISRFRAVETRRAVLRSVNMGISAVIDGNGRVQKPRLVAANEQMKHWVVQEELGTVPELTPSEWGEFKKVAGVLTATVPLDDRTSWYAVLGDWLPSLCWLLIGVVMALALVERWRGRRRTATLLV